MYMDVCDKSEKSIVKLRSIFDQILGSEFDSKNNEKNTKKRQICLENRHFWRFWPFLAIFRNPVFEPKCVFRRSEQATPILF